MFRIRLRSIFLMACLLATVGGVALYHFGRPVWVPIYTKVMGRKTVAEVIAEIGPSARTYWQSLFEAQGLAYPTRSDLVFLVSKEDRWLEVWIDGDTPVFLHSIDVTAASGTSGPKLREGDRQIPEGIYGIEGLNPNSAFHLSMKLDYPNAFDRRWGAADGRQRLGGDIFSNLSMLVTRSVREGRACRMLCRD
ncbi:MAG: hypothetical protein AAGL69_07365 [Pseudomonadota bacterium]